MKKGARKGKAGARRAARQAPRQAPARPGAASAATPAREPENTRFAAQLHKAWRLIAERRVEEAETVIRSVLSADRNVSEAWKALAAVRDLMGMPSVSKTMELRARQTSGRVLMVGAELVSVLQDSQHLEAALNLDFLDPNGLVNTALLPPSVRAQLLRAQGKPREAISWFRRALDEQDQPGLRWEYGLTLLEAGRHEEGFAQLDGRWQLARWRRKRLSEGLKNRWNGEDLNGKTLAVCTEQGLGDMIFALRFVPFVQQLQPQRLVGMASAPLAPLMQATGFFDEMTLKPEFDPESVDYWTTDADIMARCWNDGATKDAGRIAFEIAAERQARAAKLLAGAPAGDLKIGLCWTTESGSTLNLRKRISLDGLQPLLEAPGAHFVSLVKHKTYPGDLERTGFGGLVIDSGRQERDLLDTAAVIRSLDLVITIDTAVAHLAGALGAPCWMLTPEPPYWYWRGIGERSPFYASLRLVRQAVPGRWDEVTARLARDLANLRQGVKLPPRGAGAAADG